MKRPALICALSVALIAQTLPAFGTLQSVNGGVWIPAPIWGVVGAPAFTTALQLDAAADRSALVFRAPVSCDLDRVTIGVGAVATAAALDVRIEDVSTTTAAPTGNLWAANTTATTGSPVANTPIEVTLTAAATVTRGQMVAIVVQPNTTPIDVSLTRVSTTSSGMGSGFPYGIYNTAGTYAAAATLPTYGVRCSTGTWAYVSEGTGPIKAFASSAFNTGTGATTGTRRGMSITVPFPAKLSGVWWKGIVANGADYTIVLYDNTGTALQTLATIDGNNVFAAQAAQHLIYTDGDYSLADNTEYYVALVPGTANSLTLYEFSVDSAAYMDAFGGGQSFFLTKFVSSAWTEVTTERPYMGLLLTALDDGTAGGGGGGGKIIGGGV